MHNVHLHYICVLGITNMHSLHAIAYVRRYTCKIVELSHGVDVLGSQSLKVCKS